MLVTRWNDDCHSWEPFLGFARSCNSYTNPGSHGSEIISISWTTIRCGFGTDRTSEFDSNRGGIVVDYYCDTKTIIIGLTGEYDIREWARLRRRGHTETLLWAQVQWMAVILLSSWCGDVGPGKLTLLDTTGWPSRETWMHFTNVTNKLKKLKRCRNNIHQQSMTGIKYNGKKVRE